MTVTVGGDETVTNGHASQRHRLSRVQIYSTVEICYITVVNISLSFLTSLPSCPPLAAPPESDENCIFPTLQTKKTKANS
jgi:hypothetical protein